MKHDPAALLYRAPPGAAPLAGTSYLRLINISKRFGQQQVLRQLDLDIAKGEFVCLLGPSGCGKTTLLRQIAGLDAADSGSIELAGRDITRLPPAARDYGIVFQSYALFPNLTVADNIGYGLGGARAARRQRVQELLALIGLDGIAERYPAQLSGGQQQRVALARALATSPGLLLLDEPLSALDARVREHLRREIRALQQKLGITTLMVTHDQEEALTMADRVVVMNGGRIEQCASPFTVYREPASRFVASFVGQGNWLPARSSGVQQVQLGEQRLLLAAPHGIAHGEALDLFVRPEDIVLHPAWPAGSPDATLADVLKLELLGPVYRLSLLVPAWGGQRVLADVGHAQLAALGLDNARRVPVSLDLARVRAFAQQETTPCA